jgi:hypothetical protein
MAISVVSVTADPSNVSDAAPAGELSPSNPSGSTTASESPVCIYS